jgi:hypothetical protein
MAIAGAGRSRAIPLFASQCAGRRGDQGYVLRQVVVEVETSGDSRATFRLRVDASGIVALRQNGHFPSPDSPFWIRNH